MMEEVCLRFPDIGEVILDFLNEKSLENCKKVGRAWKSFIENPNQKFLWIQIIKKHEKDLIIKKYITQCSIFHMNVTAFSFKNLCALSR